MSGKMHILVVDDEPEIRRALRTLLEMLGHEVAEACHGAEALACLRQKVPGLIVSDVDMPVMDGNRFCAELAVDPVWSRIPVLLMTGHAYPQLEQIMPQLRRGGWIGKPFTLDQFLKRIQELVGPGEPH